MRYKDYQQVEVRHSDEQWYPGTVLELIFEAGKKYPAHGFHAISTTVPEDLYLVEAKFPDGRTCEVPRLFRDIRKVQPEAVMA